MPVPDWYEPKDDGWEAMFNACDIPFAERSHIRKIVSKCERSTPVSAEQVDDDLPAASIACDICGRAEPHSHDETEVQVERYARKAFEMWYALAMRSQANTGYTADIASFYRVNKWGQPSFWAKRMQPNVFGKPAGAYCEAKVESYWQAFKAAWLCLPDRLAYWNERFHFDSCGNVINMLDSEKVAEAFGVPAVSWRH